MSEQKKLKQVSIGKNFMLSTLYQVLLIVAPLITAPYVSRVLGPENTGIYSATYSIEMYFSLFAALGTASYGAREISRNRHDEKMRTRLFWEIELLTILTSAICLAVWGVFIILTPEYRMCYIVLTMNLLNSMFDISWFYKGLEQFSYTVRQNTIFKLLGIVLLFVVVRDRGDLIPYIALMSGTSLLGTMSMWIYLPKFLVRVDRREFRVLRHFRETLIYFIPTIATSVYTYLDKTLIFVITKNTAENGYYEQATKIVNLVKSVTFTSLNAVLEVRTSYLYTEKKYEEIKGLIHDSMDYIFFMGIACCLGLIGIAQRFVPFFFGEEYYAVIPMLQLLSPVVVIIGISNCLGSQYYTPAGYRKKSAGYIVTGSVVNLCMNLLLIPRFGGTGAIFGTLIAETVITVLYMANCNGYLTVKQLLSLSWKKLIAGLIMCPIVYWVGTVIGNAFLSVVLQILAGAAVYLLMLVILRDSFIFVFAKEKILPKIAGKLRKKRG